MKKILLTTAAIIAIPVLALAQTSTGSAMANSSAASGASTLNAQDRTFIHQAAIAGLAEVADGRLAETQGDASVKQIGMRMVTDHTKANTQLTSLSTQLGDPAPSTTDTTHQQSMASLQKLSGNGFDTQYLHEQLVAHEQAITLFKAEARDGGSQQLKTFASNTLPTLQMHLSMIKSALKSTNS